MIKAIHIENFRGFQTLDLSGFSKFNLVVGTNGVGKTSFLEAMLASRSINPASLASFDAQRGWARQLARIDTRGVWRYLFFDPDRPFLLETEGDIKHAQVIGRFQPSETHFLTAGPLAEHPGYAGLSQSDLSNTPKEDLYWQLSSNRKVVAAAVGQGTALGVVVRQTRKPKEISGAKVTFVLANTMLGTELFESFSALKRAGSLSPLITGLRTLHPWIEELELTTDGGPTIAASGGPHKLFPLPLLGEGVMRLTQILLSVAYVGRGIVLADEIERGFHHAVLPDIWRALRAAIGESDVQVFATTHSYECIAAADAAFADAPSDLALFRLQHVNGKLRAISYPPEARSNAIEFGSEVR